jgi:hypothetical protein
VLASWGLGHLKNSAISSIASILGIGDALIANAASADKASARVHITVKIGLVFFARIVGIEEDTEHSITVCALRSVALAASEFLVSSLQSQ